MKNIKKQGLEKLKEIKEMLNEVPKKELLCATSEIQYYDHLGESCLKKYEELPVAYKLNNTLFKYLHETLTKLQMEEFDYNRQSALNLCQIIFEREGKIVR